jgi:hypothetical protein
MKPFRTPFVPDQRECEPLKKPNTSFAVSRQSPMEVARTRRSIIFVTPQTSCLMWIRSIGSFMHQL